MLVIEFNIMFIKYIMDFLTEIGE